MAKKNKKGSAQKVDDIVKAWDEYIRDEDELENWQRLCGDLGLASDLPSKTQCRKALEKVNVNIVQFLRANPTAGEPIMFFPSKNALVRYTRAKGGRIFPKKLAKEMGPVRALLKVMFLGKDVKSLENKMHALALGI